MSILDQHQGYKAHECTTEGVPGEVNRVGALHGSRNKSVYDQAGLIEASMDPARTFPWPILEIYIRITAPIEKIVRAAGCNLHQPALGVSRELEAQDRKPSARGCVFC